MLWRVESHLPAVRICMLDHGFEDDLANGVARVTDQLARELGRLGHDVHVVGHRPSRVEADVTWHQVRVVDAGIPQLDRCSVREQLYTAVAKHRCVLELHRETPFDVVVVPNAAGEGLLVSMDPRLPAVTWIMTPMRTVSELETWLDYHEQQDALARVETEALRHARRIHAGSAAIANVVTGPQTVPERTRIVPYGVVDRLATTLPLRPERAGVHVLFVGRLERRKGADVMLKAVRLLADKHDDVTFTLVGPDMARDAAGTTYRAAFERSPHERVRFAGAVPDEMLWRLYAGADVVCFPSRYESFGNVLIEAMMFGKAVVTCAVGGVPEVIDPGETALCAEPGNAASLAEALEAVITDGALREQLGIRGRARYLEHFDVRTTAPRTLAAYLELVADHVPVTDDAEAERVLRRRFAAGLARIVGGDGADAAAPLLDGAVVAIDYVSRISRVWYLSTDDFTREVFRGVLGRDPFLSEAGAWREHLFAGGRRRDLVAELLDSAELGRRGIPKDWLPDLDTRLATEAPQRLAQATASIEFVEAATLAYLGRAPKDDERRRWSVQPPDQVLAELRAADEAARYPAAPTV
jgi:glycosyltransferase involved in cell wall biosynthesis